MNHVPEPASVACSLSQGDLARRADRWRVLAEGALEQVSRTERGQRLTFRADPGVAAELEELSALERDCCSFATWSVDQVGGQFVLDISAAGDAGVQAVQALFGDLPRSGSASRAGSAGSGAVA